MSKDAIEAEGTVIEEMPNAFFRVKLDNNQEIIGHLSGKMRLHYIKVITGDRVKIELSPYDLTKGRIVHRLQVQKG